MKTTEEKAKAYDELLAKAKQIYNKENDVLIRHTIEDLFPELAESSDEKIRKEIIHLIKKSNEQGGYALHKDEADNMIAWLEKQGEKPAEWSEEDKRIISIILGICEDFKRSFKISPASEIVQKDIDKINNWLKSLKQRIQKGE